MNEFERIMGNQIGKYHAGVNKIGEMGEKNLIDALTAEKRQQHLCETRERHMEDGTIREINIGDYAYEIVEALKYGQLD